MASPVTTRPYRKYNNPAENTIMVVFPGYSTGMVLSSFICLMSQYNIGTGLDVYMQLSEIIRLCRVDSSAATRCNQVRQLYELYQVDGPRSSTFAIACFSKFEQKALYDTT